MKMGYFSWMQKSASTYDLSATGKKYYSALTEKESDYIHEYAARIDSQLKIKIDPELFNQLYKRVFLHMDSGSAA